MKPQWRKYEEWETYQNGMYENRLDDVKIQQCFDMFCDYDTLKRKMVDVTIEYKNETLVMFSNKMFNPVSWLGQATCNLKLNATQRECCNAWLMLSENQRNVANNIAKEVIKEWRENYENIHGHKCV